MGKMAKPECQWFQFRLRTLLIAILVLSLPLSWFAVRMERARRQREAIAAIRKAGALFAFEVRTGRLQIGCVRFWETATPDIQPFTHSPELFPIMPWGRILPLCAEPLWRIKGRSASEPPWEGWGGTVGCHTGSKK